jgi:hypothetical protein
LWEQVLEEAWVEAWEEEWWAEEWWAAESVLQGLVCRSL